MKTGSYLYTTVNHERQVLEVVQDFQKKLSTMYGWNAMLDLQYQRHDIIIIIIIQRLNFLFSRRNHTYLLL